MVKTYNNLELCTGASIHKCHQCFPEIEKSQFFLREKFLKNELQQVDRFISPSYFLIERYTDWGIERNRIQFIENIQTISKKVPIRKIESDERRNRFVYIGQVTNFKGVNILLEAFNELPKKIRKEICIDIFGSDKHLNDEKLKEKLAYVQKQNNYPITYHGAYENHQIPEILEDADWVVIPSIWWENSPMVIQETFNSGRPIIASNIGGMKEKITDGVTGYHFQVRNARSLAKTMIKAMDNSDKYEEMVENLPSTPPHHVSIKEFEAVYDELLEAPTPVEAVLD
jgi:glycosyltransferase involved in cell wall biosynthesis